MINVEVVLQDMPHFETFCSVKKLHGLVERLIEDPRFSIDVAGTSVNGLPIHHVRFGKGSIKVLIVAGPHAPEPIGGLTVFSLMTLLHEGNRELAEADVEWNIVPCIDPDGALLNEGWSQKPFTLESGMKDYYVQAWPDQVDTSFPIKYKNVQWSTPSQEARVLQGIIERVKPDFYFSLHNTWTGGAFYYLSHDIDHKYHEQLYALLNRVDFPLQKRPLWNQVCASYGVGIVENFSIKKHYDYFEKAGPEPEKSILYGAASWDYLEEIKPDAFVFVAEMGHVRHPDDESERGTGQNLRQFKLKVEADSKYFATVLLKEWEKVKGDVDTASPFYKAILGGVVLPRDEETLCKGGIPVSWFPTRDTLFSPHYDKEMTVGERFDTCIVDCGFYLARMSYPFVRLLKASPQTPAIQQAIERLHHAYDEALDRIKSHIDFNAFEIFDCDKMAKVQLGSGLIVLNALLEKSKSSRSSAGYRSFTPDRAVS